MFLATYSLSHWWYLSLLQQFPLCHAHPNIYSPLLISLSKALIGTLGTQFNICATESKKCPPSATYPSTYPIFLPLIPTLGLGQRQASVRRDISVSFHSSLHERNRHITVHHSVSAFKGSCFLMLPSLFGTSGAYGGNALSRLKQEFTPVSDYLVPLEQWREGYKLLVTLLKF